MFSLLRKVLACLAWLGMTVVSVVCDGASDNRRMFSMHDSNDKMVYKIPNLYTKNSNPIFFISDPCHLLKTIRNCFARGKLWVSNVDTLIRIFIKVCLH